MTIKQSPANVFENSNRYIVYQCNYSIFCNLTVIYDRIVQISKII